MHAPHVFAPSHRHLLGLEREARRAWIVTVGGRAGPMRGLLVASMMALPFWIGLYLLLR
jgi:hypothetical protein